MTRKTTIVPAANQVRCAVYCRKSTTDGLEQEFNSIDAQREAGEAFVKSHASESWICLPQHYSDGGFTGANLERPGFQRLIADIEAGRIDTVLVYKIDRLTRSLRDFGKVMETFEKHRVALVSITQSIDTSSSMGRLVLNVLMSFAEFERALVSERTRDKIAATRRKGKWTGGTPILGYDIDPRGSRLVVNELEAIQVRQIFELYLQHQSLVTTLRELDSRGWVTKAWTTKAGNSKGGKPFNKVTLHHHLTNVLYAGQVRHKDEVYPGEHEAIVDPVLFQRVQARLEKNGRTGGAEVRNKHGALLKGLLRCTHCDCSMIHHYSSKGGKRYQYYVCLNAQKRGWQTCPAPSLPAGEIEQFVVDQIRHIGQDPELVRETLVAAQQHQLKRTTELRGELAAIERQRHRDEAELKKLAVAVDGDSALARLADLQERLSLANDRTTSVLAELHDLQDQHVDEGEVAAALAEFDAVWNVLSSREQARVIGLLIEQIDHDGETRDVTLMFHAMGLNSLATTLEEAAA